MTAVQKAARDAERRFPVRVRIAVPPEGFGSRLDQIIAWLDANCGSDRWASTPSSTRRVVNDAVAIYFADQGVHRRSRMGCIGSTMTDATDRSGPAQDALNEHATEDVVL
jgi:hypothetical protein